MSESERLRETGRWLRFAHDDLRGAEALLEREDVPPRLSCFIAQQAAEKAIKAALIFLQIEFPFRHDLDLLRTLLPDGWTLKETPESLGSLSAWAVRGRYPGDLPDATEEQAEAAIQQAREVYETILKDLEAHGYGFQDVEVQDESAEGETS
ncbi:MAG: HEPN domain-containing protein [Rubrobacteraceae bacterium]